MLNKHREHVNQQILSDADAMFEIEKSNMRTQSGLFCWLPVSFVSLSRGWPGSVGRSVPECHSAYNCEARQVDSWFGEWDPVNPLTPVQSVTGQK